MEDPEAEEEGPELGASADLWGAATHGLEVKSVVAHVDLDAFYAQVRVVSLPRSAVDCEVPCISHVVSVQVERERDPALRGKPLGVVQYNPYGDLRAVRPDEPRIVNDSNGSLIAVSYEARAAGVKRVMRWGHALHQHSDMIIGYTAC